MKKSTVHIWKQIGLIALAAILIVGTVVANSYVGLISQIFGQSTFRIEQLETEGEEVDTQYFKGSYERYSALLKDERAFAQEVQAEGTVLLKNSGLPFSKSGSITILGAGAPNGANNTGFLFGGSGSGAIDTSKVPSLKDVFESAGYQVNPTAWAYYESGAGKSTRSTNEGRIGEQPLSNMTQDVRDSFASYKDVGIVVIGRTGAEGSDLPMSTADDPSKHIMELSQNELDLIRLAAESFDVTVVLLNTMSPIELGPIEGLDISIVWVGAGGQAGIEAIPEILNGTRYPSGRTTNTYSYDVLSAPAVVNQGSFSFTNVTDTFANSYFVYAEGIYVGYRYYETRYADTVMGTANVGSYDYSKLVQYPFAYGLSYTTFEYSDFAAQDNGSSVTLSVKVTNTGAAAGKETVTFYVQSPYTDYDRTNGIEKSAVELVQFAKTAELAAGASETVSVEVSKECMRAYDANGAKTYIVDAGDYYFACGHNSHDALNNILAAQGYTTANGMTENGNAALTWKLRVDALDTETYAHSETGYAIQNQLEKADIRYYDPSFRYLTRSDWAGTFPTPYGGEGKSMAATDKMLEDIEPTYPTVEGALMPTTGAERVLTLVALKGMAYDDPAWDTLLNQLTASDMMVMISQGGFGTQAVESVSKPGTNDKDGPAGISATMIGGAQAFGYPAESVMGCTYNRELAARFGDFIGEDALTIGLTGWYAPAVNLHRSTFSGRNYEYYSEDPYLSGALAAQVVSHANAKGVITYIKHFVLNDQETNRNSACTFANEQTIRDLYLKPFEIAVREGGSNGLMTSYNRIGCVWSGNQKGLLTNVLRGEWGFEGLVITDALSMSNSRNGRLAVYAGQDMYLSSSASEISGYANDPAIISDMREACHHILYVYANSNAMNGLSSNTRMVSVTPMWQIVLYIADAVLLLGIVALSILNLRKIVALVKDGEAPIEDSISIQSPLAMASMISLGIAVLGVALAAIGGLLSKPEAVGVNLNFSPVLLLGCVLVVVGLVLSLVAHYAMKKNKQQFKLSNVAILIGVLAVIFAVVCVMCVMLLPIIFP